ncbi:cryptochrome [Hortaea werneckii]|nr:cryptochrome [Hortaea werneckii]
MSRMSRILIYLVRRDLRTADNPVFHEIERLHSQSQKPFTHVLPVYVFPANQIEISGFLRSENEKSPYPEARSIAGRFWRCGRLRAKFIAESVWDLKTDLEGIGSGLAIRVGETKDVVKSLLDGYRERSDAEVHGLWMTSEEGWEEIEEERHVKDLVQNENKEFKLWTDEKYYVDGRDLPFKDIKKLSDVFTEYRKTVEPLREAPRKQLPKPRSLPPMPEHVPQQFEPFKIPDTLEGTIEALHKPLHENLEVSGMPSMPPGVSSAHPFIGGSKAGHARLRHLIESGAMTSYKDTRNGLLGLDFSTKLSAWLALGSVSARQIHWQLMDFEDAKTDVGKGVEGYGKGENKGTAGVRFELLWRDYMRLCTRKYGTRLFYLGGYKGDKETKFKMISSPYSKTTERKNTKGVNDQSTKAAVERFLRGETGTGLIDASQRELFLTGWTSNRARQNVASYLTKHLGIDWRIGAEWYETNLVDYDVSSNWGNWQYVAGVGNDPRGSARVFNPVKQALDYDSNGDYVRAWIPQLRDVGKGNQKTYQIDDVIKFQERSVSETEELMGVFQAWRLPQAEKKRLGLEGVEWVENPLIKIDFSLNRRGGGKPRGRSDAPRGRGRGGGGFRGRGRGRGDLN